MMKKYLHLLLLILLTVTASAQSPTAASQTQFCGDITLPPFPNSTDAGSATLLEAASYGCLGSQPNPAWFYTQIDESGDITFTMEQVDVDGQGIDVDFIAWGPFDGPPPIYGPQWLNPANEVGCSYSTAPIESFTLTGAQSGDYYVILITNFSNDPGTITLEFEGTGTLNCLGCEFEEIDDFILCNGVITPVTAVLTSTVTNYDPAQTTYQWYRAATAAQAPGAPIPGAVSTTLNISSPGVYTIIAENTFCGSSGVEETFTVLPQGTFPTSNPESILFCSASPAPYNFNLRDNDPIILNSQDPARYVTSYYNSSAAANAGTSPIASPTAYSSNGNGEVIYVRVDDLTTGCKIVRSFTLTASTSPEATTPPDLQVCDNPDNDAVNGEGIEIFNLSSQTSIILGSQSASRAFVTYHRSMADLVAGVSIPLQNAVPSDGETVYVRVSSSTNFDCYAVTTFNLVVTPYPIVTPPANVVVCSNEEYRLPPIAVGGYFTGPNGLGDRRPVGDLVTEDSVIFIYAESGTTPNNCTDSGFYTVTFLPAPVAQELDPVTVCTTYNLPALNEGNRYFSATGGPDGGGTEYFAGRSITASEDVYIYTESVATPPSTTICSDESIFSIIVTEPPVAGTVTPIVTCDGFIADDIESIDLRPAGAQAINGQPDLEVSYHESAADAEAGLNPIDRPATYLTGTATIYIRLTKTTDIVNCPTVVPFQVTIYPNPVPSNVPDYTVCDVNNSPDGIEEADLTEWDSQVTSDPTDTVIYYLSNTDAQLDQNRIPDPERFSNTASPGEQRIWIRVTSSFGCVGVGSFLFRVTPLPVINTAMEPFYTCEGDTPGIGVFDLDLVTPVLTLGAGGYTVTYYSTEAAAQTADASALLATPYTTASTTIYARVDNYRTGCYTTAPVSLVVRGIPAVTAIEPVYSCDPENDNTAVFNLQPRLDEVAAAIGDVTLTAHETYDDAFYFGGRNPILNTTAYNNVVANTSGGVQILYVRVQDALTECFTVAPFRIIVNPVPEAAEPAQDYTICDNGESDTDTLGLFDLTTYETEVLNGMNPSQFLVTYFHSYDDAANNFSAIATPETYLSASNSEVIFIKVTNSLTGCFDVVELQLTVNALPVAFQPTAITVCDDNGSGDETEVFDLTTKIPEITGGASGVDVTFYDTFTEAETATNAYTEAETLAYSNTSPGVQSIFVRVTNRESGCYRIVLLDVRVEALPSITMPTAADLTLCDTDSNGYAVIDLDALVADMLNNGGAGVTVNFYLTEQDAVNGVRPIQNTSAYANVTPYTFDVWVVAQNGATGCSTAPIMLTFTVQQAPQVPDLAELDACDDEDGELDGSAEFKLTDQDVIIRAAPGITATTLIEYYTDEASALNGAPMIVRPDTYSATDGTVIWVRTEDPLTGCFSITSFELNVHLPVDVTEPQPYILCSDTTNGVAEFDLTTRDELILAPTGLGQENVVTYYESDAAVEAGTPITNPEAYSNLVTENPKTLSVVVTTTFGCESRTYLTLIVLPKPRPDFTPDVYELCEDMAAATPLTATFDLTSREGDISNGGSNLELSYYETQESALAGDETVTEFITDPVNYVVTDTTTVYVRVSLAGSEPDGPSCTEVVALQLQVNPLPATSIRPYAICQQPFTGTATFDLGNYRNEILGAGAVLTDYMVRFYEFNPDVIPPGIGNPSLSYNYSSATKEIFVYAMNLETECEVVLPLTLSVEPQTVAGTVPAGELDECDYDGVNDGVYEIDLTEANVFIITQTPVSDYEVKYYLSAAEALTDTNAIVNPSAYPTATTRIYAMVRNINPLYVTGCPDYTEFDVTIEQIPEPLIVSTDNQNISCVNFETGEEYRRIDLHTQYTTAAGYGFEWFKDGVAIAGATDEIYFAVESGIYTVVVTGPSVLSCESLSSDGFEVIKSGPASLIEDGYVVSNAFTDNQSITILVEGFGEYQYSMFANGPWQNSNVFTNVPIGYHTIYIQDATAGTEACATVVIEDVSTIDYPKFFTPNNDGYNDYWNIIGLANFPSAEIHIFDRYGKLLKQLSPRSNPTEGEGWDGTFNGNPLPSDDYWFTVTFPEGNTVREFKAHFAMKR